MRMMSSCAPILWTLVLGSMLESGCRAPQGSTVEEKRDYVWNMAQESLAQLYRQQPEAKMKVEKAPGYGVFSNVGSKIFLLATGNGFGVVVDNKTGKRTHMKMIEAGGGLGIGFKTYKAIYVFNTSDALQGFVAGSWQAGGDADATAKVGEKGAAGSAPITTDELTKPVTVYQLTDTGVALSAVATGTKYSVDSELN